MDLFPRVTRKKLYYTTDTVSRYFYEGLMLKKSQKQE